MFKLRYHVPSRYLGIADNAINGIYGRPRNLFFLQVFGDFVKRYTQRFFGEFDMAPFGGLFDDILATCVAADLVPEINTSTIRKGVGEAMPTPETLARYVQAGGTGVSFGSDAHRSEDVGVDFDEVVPLLQKAGITHAVALRNRTRHEIPLD